MAGAQCLFWETLEGQTPSVALQKLGPAAPVTGLWGWGSLCPEPHGLSASQAAGSLPIAAHVVHCVCLLGSSTGFGGGGWAAAGDLNTVPGQSQLTLTWALSHSRTLGLSHDPFLCFKNYVGCFLASSGALRTVH